MRVPGTADLELDLSTGKRDRPPYRGRLPAKHGTRTQAPAKQGTSSGQTRHSTRPPVIPGNACCPSVRRARSPAGSRDNLTDVYFTDRGIEELAARRGEDQVSLEWLAEHLRTFVDLHPELETPIERLATWLARLDDDED